MAILFMASLKPGQAFDVLTNLGKIRVKGTGRVLVDPALDPDTDTAPGVLSRIEAYNKAHRGSFVELGEADVNRPLLDWIPEPTAGDDQIRLWLAVAKVDYSRAKGPKGLRDMVTAEVQRLERLGVQADADAAGVAYLREKAAAAGELTASLVEAREANKALAHDLAQARKQADEDRAAMFVELKALKAQVEAGTKPESKPKRGNAKAVPGDAKPDAPALVE